MAVAIAVRFIGAILMQATGGAVRSGPVLVDTGPVR
jgi:hypothetical protein